ncbi:WcbI family polysaccharide biosynthesis putative acetyltransferase [Naasia lichenicola]|uniref:Polysaccharide biosynthesis enzyme WcbI domain-containing protein n=1 Tax=Naasia lichenicola TaxID=2565933 RepID=A0A4S4FIK2_9MICO|nr:WcbI family polysaccharide biosynthesis putative acetyltransferase [Naasia lichenicola]THG29908.1 hypothetical protein E6C64_14775 [Naasia lichenicola]
MTTADPHPEPDADAVELSGRTLHYGAFYGVTEIASDRPILLVHGNCQAESIRIMLSGTDVETVRIPPVHELTEADVPHLDRLLGRASYLVSQPVRADYHSLSLGTQQLVDRLSRGARTALIPVVRFAGLYPFHAIVRPPTDPSLSPPLVAYHDLRTLAEAGRLLRGEAAGGRTEETDPTSEQVHDIARASLRELQTREQHHGTVRASDLFDSPDFEAMRTLNHPGNRIFAALADRLRTALGLGAGAAVPRRPLLNSVHAPRSAAVIEAYGLNAEPRAHWLVDGRELSEDEVRVAHLDWYRAHPDAVTAGLTRHAFALTTLGLR